MIIDRLEFKSYTLPFNRTLFNSKSTLSERQICIIQINSENLTGIGECSPMPGLNRESFQDILEELDKLKKDFSIEITNYSQNEISPFINKIKYPSLQFAFDQALFNIFNKKYPYLSQKNIIKEICPLISYDDPDRIYNSIDNFYNVGFRTFKIKSYVIPFRDEKLLLQKIAENFPDIKLRLDTNGKLRFPFVFDYIEAVKNLPLEYLEQPMNCLDDNVYAQKYSPLPIAVDESVKTFEDAEFAIRSGIKYLILKPVLLGGLLKTIEIIKLAEQNGVNPIISSCFESNIGFQIPLILASQCSHNLAQGLSTFTYFDKNIIPDYFPFTANEIDISKINFQDLDDFRIL